MMLYEGMEWKEVSGVQVSRCGHAMSLISRMPFLPRKNAGGYRGIRRGAKTFKMHDLVARAFIGAPPHPDATVDHINRDRSDNRAENLRWATRREQRANQRSIDHQNHGANNPVQYRKVGSEDPWEDASSMQQLAGLIGANQGHISKCVNKKAKSHKGYEFRRAPEQIIKREEWAEIDNNAYVSNMGRVRHMSSPAFFPKIVAGMEYPMFRHRPVHCFVAEAFVGPAPFADATIDHIDRNKMNSKASNLRWANKVEQRANQMRTESVSMHQRPVIGWIGGDKKWFSSRLEAERLTGVMAQNIAKCVCGKRRRAGGFVWEQA